MLERLRSPWLAALLLLASPALGGQLMPALHPCEGAGAGHAHGGTAGHAADHASHEAASDPVPPTDRSCTCIGSCHVPAIPGPPAATVVALVGGSDPLAVAAILPRAESPRRAPPPHLLPPPTAPPHA